MKRTLSLLLACIMMLSILPTVSLADEEEPIVITWYQELDGKATASMQSMDESPTWQYIQEKFNIDIEFIHPASGQAKEQFNLMLASRELPDIIYYGWTGVTGGPAQLVEDGLLLDLTDLLEEKCPNYWKVLQDYPEIAKQVSLNDGTYYCFGKLFPDPRSMSYEGPVIRQDWLDKLNLECPTTIAEWEVVLEAFKTQDPNGNGEADEIPIVSIGLDHIRRIFAPAYQVRSGLHVSLETGKITFGQIEPGYREYLEKMAEWYAKGYIDAEFIATDGTARQNKMVQNLGGVCFGSCSGVISTILNIMQPTQPEYDLAGAYPVKSENGIAYASADSLKRAFIGQGLAVSANTKHLDKVLELLDFCFSEEGYELLNWGILGESYEIDENGNRDYTDLIYNNPDGLTVAQAAVRYCYPHSNMAVLNDYNARKLIEYGMPQQLEASSRWADCDYSMLTPLLLPTAEDSSRQAELLNEINTYCQEMETQLIMGRVSFDEYDKFVENLYKMGIEEVIEIQQRTYDAYLNK